MTENPLKEKKAKSNLHALMWSGDKKYAKIGLVNWIFKSVCIFLYS